MELRSLAAQDAQSLDADSQMLADRQLAKGIGMGGSAGATSGDRDHARRLKTLAVIVEGAQQTGQVGPIPPRPITPNLAIHAMVAREETTLRKIR
jgi:hypothetical protein